MSMSVSSATPVISVAMPVYNGERYLSEALESILAQTYTNFEFIIIDDGSTDSSLKVLQQYQKRDARIRLISRENRNLATTLNDIIDLAQGKWIARMDQDDIALPHRFERQLQWLEQTGADITGSWVQFFGTSDMRILKHPQSDEANKMELLFGCPFAHPTVMMKAELVKQLRYDKDWEKCEDYDLWERAAHVGWKMTNVPEVLLSYRQHDMQISSASSTRQHQLSQSIRRRYWCYVFDKMELNKVWIGEVLKLRDISPAMPDMDGVDSVFNALLQRNLGEARTLIFDHITRLYFRAAATCPDVVSRWGRLNSKYSNGLAIDTKVKLWLLSTFRIQTHSKLFTLLKKLHFYFSRSI
jgi:glycosyltransferase involved in cell wall biosynthesis